MDEDPGAEVTAVATALARTFMETWNRQDGPAYGEVYWPDAELVDPAGAIWNGPAAIAQLHVDLWRGPAQSTRVETRVRRVRSLGPSVAIVDVAVSVAGIAAHPPGARTGPDGKLETRLKHVVEKRGAEWKIVASQNIFVANPPGENL